MIPHTSHITSIDLFMRAHVVSQVYYQQKQQSSERDLNWLWLKKAACVKIIR